MRSYRADVAWTPDGPLRDAVVTVAENGCIAEVRRARGAPSGEQLAGEEVSGVEEVGGLLLPGLVNAHAHLELSELRGEVPGGEGLVAWVGGLMARRPDPDPESISAAIAEGHAAGTAAFIDVSNSGATLGPLAAAGLPCLVQVEVVGIGPERVQSGRVRAAALLAGAEVPAVETCHAVVSCETALLAAVLSPSPEPAPARTFHCAEDPDDHALLAERGGPWAAFLDGLGRDWRDRVGDAASPVALLDSLGLLGPHLALVHCVHASPHDLDRIAATGTAVVLCPRSNLHIGGRLPDVVGMVARGIPLAVGTDSLASSPDLDLLGEAAVLARAFPDVDAGTWLTALTTGGARLLDPAPAASRPDGAARGGLVPGARHGLLHVDLPADSGDPLAALLDGTPWPRRWLCPPLP